MNCMFSTLNLDNDLVESLSSIGIVRPSYTQYKFIKSAINESSIIFQSKSGSGKTVAFCISLLHKIINRSRLESEHNSQFSTCISQYISKFDHLLGDALIIVPTRELSYHIYLFFVSLKNFLPIIKSTLLIGNTDIFKSLSYMKCENVNILVSTPGRFITILKCKPDKIDIEKYGYKSNQPYFKTHTLIFDEADLLLDEQFYEQTKYICSKISSPFVQIIAVSATFIKPQLKSFENMICELDHNYINKFVKTHSNITEDILGTNHRLRYYVSHLLLSNKIERLDDLLNYLSGYERVFERIIHSSSNVKSALEIKTRTCDEYNQSIITDTDGEVDLDIIVKDQYDDYANVIDCGNASHGQDMSSVTSVIDKITFYFSLVKDAPNIVMQIGYKIQVLVKLLANVKYKKCIIFSNQSHIRLQIYAILKYLGYTCYIISSRMSHGERVMMLYDLNSVENVVILCTDVMSRGIGLSNVDLVINMDIPGSKEIFLHRSGRCGRFGSKGVCVSICMESELETYNYFVFALNFKSISVDAILDSDVSVNGIVSDHLMNAIDFVNIQDECPGIKKIINPSLSSLMLNTEEYKFNVSIIGFISDTDIMLINTGNTQVLMYIDIIGFESVITIKQTDVNQVFFESFSSNVELIYSESDKTSNDYRHNNNNLSVTHIVLKMDHSHVLISLPRFEFMKFFNSKIKSINYVKLNKPKSAIKIGHDNKCDTFQKNLNHKLSQLFESKFFLNYYDFKSMLNESNGYNNDYSYTDSYDQLLRSLYALNLRNYDIIVYFTDYVNGKFHDLLKLYISCSETITAFKESTDNDLNLNTIRNHFIKTHVSLWNSLNK